MDGTTADGRDRGGSAADDDGNDDGDHDRYSVRISDPGEVAAAVPHLLGFHPTESVVLIGLTGPEGNLVGVTARADLTPARYAGRLAADLTRTVRRSQPRAVLVVIVSEAPDDGGGEPELPHRALLRELLLELSAADLPVRDMLLVRSRRWWSYDCPYPCCAPHGGTPLPDTVSPMAAASVVTGTVVARDRAELAARLAASDGPTARAMALTCARMVGEIATRAAEGGTRPLAAESWAAIRAATLRCAPGAAPGDRLTDAEVARILCGLRDGAVRDRAMGLALGEDAEAAEALWSECTRRAPAPLSAPPATLLAVSAWLRGDGAMANVALDRALAADPGYRLAELLADALAKAVAPDEIRELVRTAVSTLPDPRPAG